MNKLFILLSLALFGTFAANAQNDIHEIDFANFTYDVEVADEREKFTVTEGSYSRDDDDDKVFFSAKVAGYGDLNRDGKDEAIIITMLNTGGTGNFTGGQIYTIKNGKPVILTEFAGGDRAFGGLVDATISRGILTVERYREGKDGGACCPEYVITTKFTWNGSKLVQLGKPVTRDLVSLTRIHFDKGSFLTVRPIKIAKYNRQRFVVGARKGQTLMVSSAAENFSYALFKGNGAIEITQNGMIVKLQETGDYVFEIVNNNDQDLNISITVQID